MRASRFWLSGIMLSCALTGCSTSGTEDDSMYLTGTEEHAITFANGEVGCTNPKKVLICHIPPGNPDNAHDICVSENAVGAHQTHHGDLVGACDGGGETPDAGVPVPDAGVPDDHPDAAPAPDAGGDDPIE